MIFSWNIFHKTALWVAALAVMLAGCFPEKTRYRTFADYPGFETFYAGRCLSQDPDLQIVKNDRDLLERYRPRLILPPGGRYPVDFYRDYLPYTVLVRYSDGEVVGDHVTPELLRSVQEDRLYYLDFQFDRYRSDGMDRRLTEREEGHVLDSRRPVIYGRIYRETVHFPTESGQSESRTLLFLKYNLVFAVSGLPERLPGGYETFLRFVGLDPEDWHELDNFVAVHIVLDERERPLAVILAQHNHHRTYLIGRDLPLPPDGRLRFDIAARSNEVYPDSESKEPQAHRVVSWSLYMKFLLSGTDPPFSRGEDITYGVAAAGKEFPYDLKLLSPCDPFYTAKIMLGEPRPFFGRYVGRDGPPGADYYAVPELLLLGNLLKFSYLHDGDPEDIRLVEEAIDRRKRTMDIPRMLDYGGRKLMSERLFWEDASSPAAATQRPRSEVR